MSTNILCRKDSQNVPVVFITDSLQNGQILAWKAGEKQPDMVGLDYYHSTDFLPDEEAAALAKRYSRATGDKSIIMRQRLPRKYRLKGEATPAEPAMQANSEAPKKRGRSTTKKRGRPLGSKNKIAEKTMAGMKLTKKQQADLKRRLNAVFAEIFST